MADKKRILDLAKLVISAAWADGELANDEINALKDLLFRLDEVSGEDWDMLSMYMDHPTSAEEHAELLQTVLGSIRTPGDKAFILETLEELFRCDGVVTPEEEAVLESIRGEMAEIGTGLFSGLGRALKSAIVQRKDAVESSSLREHDAHDYTHNIIYYDLKRKGQADGVAIDLPEPELRKICLATGLLSRVAHADEEISPEERVAMCEVLTADWKLSNEQAELLIEIGCTRAVKGLDFNRLTQSYFACTDNGEREEFLKTLFRIANAAHKTSNDEIEEIRAIARALKIAHNKFVEAKVTISREDRGGF